jgi:malate dehydrogenase (oxaloacetate-decarboxylating)
LVFPAIFRGALQARIPQILDTHKIAAAEALAACVEHPSVDKIIPGAFDAGFVDAVVKAVIAVK